MREENSTHHVQTVNRTNAPRTVLVGSTDRVRGHGYTGNNMVRQTSRTRENRENIIGGSGTQQTL